MSDHENGPIYDGTTVGYNVSSKTYAYLRKCIELGALEGGLGHMKPSEYLEPVIDALHEVLAGGEVEFKIKQRGSTQVKADLDQRVAEAAVEANAINQAARYYVCLVP